ncbi:MAG: PAS domain-containing protein [Pseudomonadota bacterium]
MNQDTYQAILDSVKNPIVFVDNDHIIRYLNRSAKVRYYEKRGYSDLIGKSILDCHNSISANQITEAHDRLQKGENEVYLEPDKNQERVTVVVGVRDVGGILLGYYARSERQNRIQLNATPSISC